MLKCFFKKLSIAMLYLLFYQDLYAASVKKVLKKRRIVIINVGKNEGITKGTKVCFLKDSGKKVACGRVRKVKSKISVVKVSKKRIRRIKRGMEASYETGNSGTKVASSSSNLSNKKTQVQVFYLITPMAPSTFKKLNYSEPQSGAETMWESSGDVGSAYLGLGANVIFSMFGKTIGAGARMRTYTSQKAEGYYQENTPSQYALTELEASSVGFWMDYYYFDTKMSMFLVKVAAGIDIDMTTVDLTSTQGDDNTSDNNPIASATSKATTLSIRNLVNIYMDLGGFGVGTMVNFLLPLYSTSSFSGSVEDPNSSNLGVEPVDDLDVSLDHKKAAFGLELMLHGYYSF